MTTIKWIKLSVDMFSDEKIKLIQAMPEGDALLIIWIKLLTLAGKTNLDGYLLLNENIPYTKETLSIVTEKPISIVELALKTFNDLGMIAADETGMYLVNYDKYQSTTRLQEIREYNRLAQQRHREKIKQKKLSMTNVNDKSITSQRSNALDIDKDIDIDKYKEKEIIKEKENITIYDIYQIEIGTLTSRQFEKLRYFSEKLNDELVTKAIEIASDNNAKTFKYIETILTDWVNKGYTSIKEIEQSKKNKKVAPVPEWINKDIESKKISKEDFIKLINEGIKNYCD